MARPLALGLFTCFYPFLPFNLKTSLFPLTLVISVDFYTLTCGVPDLPKQELAGLQQRATARL